MSSHKKPTQPAPRSWTPASRTLEINFHCLSHSLSLWYLVMAAQTYIGTKCKLLNSFFNHSLLCHNYLLRTFTPVYCQANIGFFFPLYYIHRTLERKWKNNSIICKTQISYPHPSKEKHHHWRLSTPKKNAEYMVGSHLQVNPQWFNLILETPFTLLVIGLEVGTHLIQDLTGKT